MELKIKVICEHLPGTEFVTGLGDGSADVRSLFILESSAETRSSKLFRQIESESFSSQNFASLHCRTGRRIFLAPMPKERRPNGSSIYAGL